MRLRVALLVVVAAVLVAACGSRLPEDTLQAIDAKELGASDGTAAAGRGATDGGAGAAADAAPEGARSAAGGTASAGGAPAGATPDAGAVNGGSTGPAGQAAATAGKPAAGAGAATRCTPGSATGRGVTPKEIKVASIVTDSGPLPGATEGSYRGAAAYFAMINAQGGVCGRKLVLLKGDDGLDPARARGEFLRLEPQVLGFVGSYSVADSGYTDLIAKTNVPFVGLTVDPSGRSVPSVWPKLRDDIVSTGPFVWWKQQHPDATRAALLYADVGGVKANVPGTAAAIERAGFKLVQPPIPVGVADPDYTGQVRNLQDKKVDFVFLFAFEVNMHVRFARNMKQQGYEPKIKGSLIAFNDRFSKLLGAAGDGWENYLTYLPFLDPAEKGRSPAVNAFLTWNTRVFPGGQLDLFNVAGWGRAAYFVEALRKVGPDVDRARLLTALGQLPTYDDGGVGMTVKQPSGDFDRCFVMARHTGGSWKRVYPGSGYECGLGEVFKFK